MACLYHRTTKEAAAQILRDGFRDGTDFYLTDSEHSGVWLSDRPLDVNEGVAGHAGLVIDLPDELLARWAADYEWVEEGKPYREFLVPAALVNQMPRRLEALDV